MDLLNVDMIDRDKRIATGGDNVEHSTCPRSEKAEYTAGNTSKPMILSEVSFEVRSFLCLKAT